MNEPINEARERVLDAAESLFMESGYAAVKIKDIAEKLAMRDASLYYHFPKGKEELYIAVMHRNLARHQAGMEKATAEAGSDWVAGLRAAAYWLLSQPTLDLVRINQVDLPALKQPNAAYEIEEAAHRALNLPIRRVLEQAQASGEADIRDMELIAGVFISLIAGIAVIKAEWNPKTKREMADTLIDSWVNGLRRR